MIRRFIRWVLADVLIDTKIIYRRLDNHADILNELRKDIQRVETVLAQPRTIPKPTVDEEQVAEIRKKQLTRQWGLSKEQADLVDWSRVL